jgi:hypothetical protein
MSKGRARSEDARALQIANHLGELAHCDASELHFTEGTLTVHLATSRHAAVGAGGRDGAGGDGLAAQALDGGHGLVHAQRVVAVVIATVEGGLDGGTRRLTTVSWVAVMRCNS